MNIPPIVLSLLRHTGYALVVLAALLIGIEFFVPAFATPYLHLYCLLAVGLGLSLLARQTHNATMHGKWGIGVVVTGILLLAVVTQLSLRESTLFLALAASALIIVFFVLSVYSKDL